MVRRLSFGWIEELDVGDGEVGVICDKKIDFCKISDRIS